jgi:hypothetical protein
LGIERLNWWCRRSSSYPEYFSLSLSIWFESWWPDFDPAEQMVPLRKGLPHRPREGGCEASS